MKLRVGELNVLERKLKYRHAQLRQELHYLKDHKPAKKERISVIETMIETLDLAIERIDRLWMIWASKLAYDEKIDITDRST